MIRRDDHQVVAGLAETLPVAIDDAAALQPDHIVVVVLVGPGDRLADPDWASVQGPVLGA